MSNQAKSINNNLLFSGKLSELTNQFDRKTRNQYKGSAEHGYCYCLLLTNGSYKIGQSRSPFQRFHEFMLQYEADENLAIEHVWLSSLHLFYRTNEGILHKKFAPKRRKGTLYFNLKGVDIENIFADLAIRTEYTEKEIAEQKKRNEESDAFFDEMFGIATLKKANQALPQASINKPSSATNNLIPFNFNNQDIRIVEKDNEAWFVAKDICEALGITWQGKKTLSILPNEWKGVVKLPTPENNRGSGGGVLSNHLEVGGGIPLIERGHVSQYKKSPRYRLRLIQGGLEL